LRPSGINSQPEDRRQKKEKRKSFHGVSAKQDMAVSRNQLYDIAGKKPNAKTEQ
jgi:hypothetical protein